MLRTFLTVVFGGAALLIAIGVLLLWLAEWNMCGNSGLQEYVSPTGAHKVVVFVRNCGATTNFSTQASLLRAGSSLPNDPGNLMILDDNHGAAGLDDVARLRVKVNFLSETDVSIEYPRTARVFQLLAARDGVAVHYDVFPR